MDPVEPVTHKCGKCRTTWECEYGAECVVPFGVPESADVLCPDCRDRANRHHKLDEVPGLEDITTATYSGQRQPAPVASDGGIS